MASSPGGCCGITRRGFLLGAATRLAGGVPAAWLAARHLPGLLPPRARFSGRPAEVKRPALAMPGPYAGRVVGAVGSISSFPLLVKVVRCLLEVGLRPQDIIVFERYAEEFCDAGYADLVGRELPGVRWLASAWAYSNSQTDIAGFDAGR